MNSQMIGSYKLLRELGSGGMGTVYEAVDTMLERRVAIKMLRPGIALTPDLIDRFRSEAVTLAKLNHPSVATLFAFLHEGGRFAMVMEYVPGRPLEALLASAGRLSPELAVDVLRQTLDGVAHAHQMGVLHRDIKPANIMITDQRVVKVTDFGIARILGSSRMTREGKIIGTLEYIAPERIRGEAGDHRCDIYSAGVVLYEMLAGRLPFTSDTDYGLLQAHLERNPPELSALGVACPPALEAILNRALAKSPDARFQSAREFHDALAGACGAAAFLKPTRLAGPVEEALKPTRLAALPTPAPPAPNLRLAFAAAVFCVAGIAGVALLNRPGAQPETAPVASTPAPLRTEPANSAADLRQLPPEPVFQPPAFLTPNPQAPSAPISATPEPAVRARRKAEPETPAPPPVPATRSVTTVQQPLPNPAVQLPPLPEVKASLEPAPPPIPARPKSIRGVHRLFVEKMSHDLDSHIQAEIREQLPSLALVARRDDADAVMKGSVEKRGDAGSAVTRGYLGLKSEYTATVTITGIGGGAVLWTGEAGDSRAVIGVIRRGGPRRVAQRLVKELKKAMKR